jgi:intracellular sulfur oxidation DsrE/DsrF family protein
MRKLLTLTVLAMLTLGTGCATMFGQDIQKVVYHINYNDEAQLKAALGNVKNHVIAIGKDKIDVKVVMHGNGVDLLKTANTDLDMQQ